MQKHQNQFSEFEAFKRKVDCIFEKHALFIEKYINKQIIKRSPLCSTFHNSRSNTDQKAYNAQWKLSVSLIRQAKKQYFLNLNTHDAIDNKTFLEDSKALIDRQSRN